MRSRAEVDREPEIHHSIYFFLCASAALREMSWDCADGRLSNNRRNIYIAVMALAKAPQKHARRRFDSAQQEAYLNLWRTYDRLRAMEDELFSRFDLTAQQYNALRLLRAAHPQTIPTLTLASRLISRAPDITRLLDRLDDLGLINRERPSDNRRTVRIGITDDGLALLDELASQVKACHARQLGHLSARQLRHLVELLAEARAPHEVEASGRK